MRSSELGDIVSAARFATHVRLTPWSEHCSSNLRAPTTTMDNADVLNLIVDYLERDELSGLALVNKSCFAAVSKRIDSLLDLCFSKGCGTCSKRLQSYLANTKRWPVSLRSGSWCSINPCRNRSFNMSSSFASAPRICRSFKCALFLTEPVRLISLSGRSQALEGRVSLVRRRFWTS